MSICMYSADSVTKHIMLCDSAYSAHGNLERHRDNNHGIWFHQTALSIALHVGDEDTAIILANDLPWYEHISIYNASALIRNSFHFLYGSPSFLTFLSSYTK